MSYSGKSVIKNNKFQGYVSICPYDAHVMINARSFVNYHIIKYNLYKST